MVASKFKIKKHVTVPLLKISDSGVPAYVKFTGEIFRAKVNESEQKKYEGALASWEKSDKKEPSPQAPNPPELAHVINLETGEVAQIIISAILGSELRDGYPNGGYVGKGFEIKKSKPTGSKRYAMFQIAEVELEDEPVEAETPVKAPAATKK